LGIWGGHWLDGKFNTGPLWLIIGLILGIAVAVLGVYNMLKPFMEKAKKTDNNSQNDKDNKQ
jgi:F0F1-type ATP synthase assembly protein I